MALPTITPSKSFFKDLTWPRVDTPNPIQTGEDETFLILFRSERVFKEISLSGISAREDIMEFEKKRFQKNLKIAAWDFLNLRRVISRRITREIIKLLHLFLNLRKTESLNPQSLLEESGLFKISQDLENCLDILALCKK